MSNHLPILHGLTTVLPSHGWDQATLYETFFAGRFAGYAKAADIFRNAAVQRRHFALDLPRFYAEPQTIGTRSTAYVAAARTLGEEACQQALAKAGLTGADIDLFVVASCTGFAMPDLDVLLGPALGLRRDVQRLTIGETGSHAGLPAVARASDHVRAYPTHRALVLVVEVSSANLDLEPTGENVVSAAIFADGATACVVEGADVGRQGLSVVAAGTSTYFETASEMTYEIGPAGLHFHLGRRVPEVLAGGIGESIDGFLASQGLNRADIGRWVSHPGGRLILDRIETAMGFDPEALASSRRTLAQVGNLAAATVFFVLADSLAQKPTTPGERLLMLGYGPGLAVEMLLLQA
jgi:alkylresorcinol/alkylpyrone synthase